MRKSIVLISIILLSGFVKAQLVSPKVMATSGGFFSNVNISVSWTSGEIMTETFTTGSSIFTQGFQQPGLSPVISGQLTYKNAANTPISGAKIYLKTLSGTIIDSTITLYNGSYRFYFTPPGTYIFKIKVNTAWGGSNATDALLTLKHFVALITLTDLYKVAANVDNSSMINSLDALFISKRFTGLINSFAVNDWLYKTDTILLGVSPLTHNLKVICAGDVNGSYIPSLNNFNRGNSSSTYK